VAADLRWLHENRRAEDNPRDHRRRRKESHRAVEWRLGMCAL
jgi:hypothetical protein